MDTFSIPLLLKTVQSRRIDAAQLITHRFMPSEMLAPYDTSARAADTRALKVIVENGARRWVSGDRVMSCS